MIYYELRDENRFKTRFHRLADAESEARACAEPDNKITVFKVTEQHLGTYHGKQS